MYLLSTNYLTITYITIMLRLRQHLLGDSGLGMYSIRHPPCRLPKSCRKSGFFSSIAILPVNGIMKIFPIGDMRRFVLVSYGGIVMSGQHMHRNTKMAMNRLSGAIEYLEAVKKFSTNYGCARPHIGKIAGPYQRLLCNGRG